MYAIKRINDGKYVSIPGSYYSYTDNLRKAQIFSTKEKAENSICPGNEIVVNIESELHIY